jgi:hypothetical protein
MNDVVVYSHLRAGRSPIGVDASSEVTMMSIYRITLKKKRHMSSIPPQNTRKEQDTTNFFGLSRIPQHKARVKYGNIVFMVISMAI